jgi:very-short-patch-repair endonuclease
VKIPQRLNRSPLEVLMAFQMDRAGLTYTSEYRFHETRKWRVDFAFLMPKVAIEIEGGTWVSGRHNRGAGMHGDMEKYNELTLAGWRLLRFTGDMVKSGEALKTVERALKC